MNSPIALTERQPIHFLRHLIMLGIGTQFTPEQLLSARPLFLKSEPRRSIEELARRIEKDDTFFSVLREVARYIFSGGAYGYLGDWRDEYDSIAWTDVRDNPGILADSWIASLSPSFRHEIGIGFRTRLLACLNSEVSGLDKEYLLDELSMDEVDGQVQTALNQARFDGLFLERRDDFAGLYPFRAETLAELCLFSLDFPKDFFTRLASLVKVEEKKNGASMAADFERRFGDLRFAPFSRTLWTFSLISKTETLLPEECFKEVCKFVSPEPVFDDINSMDNCLIRIGLAHTEESAESLRKVLSAFHQRAKAIGSSSTTNHFDLSGFDGPKRFAMFCQWRALVSEWSDVLDGIEEWSKVEIPLSEVLRWVTCRVQPDDAALATREGLSPSSTPSHLLEAGLVVSPDNLRRWNGLEPKEILNAIDRGFTCADDFLPFKEGVLDFEEVLRLRELVPEEFPVHQLERFSDLLRAGVEPQFAMNLSEFKKLSIKQVLELESLKLDGEFISEWCRDLSNHATRMSWLSISRPPRFSSAKFWISQGLGPRDYERFLELIGNGLSSIEAAMWAGADVTPDDYQLWRELGIGLVSEVKMWRKFRCSPQDVKIIKDRLGGDANEFLNTWIVECEKRGTSIHFIYRLWMLQGVNPQVAFEWSSHQLSPMEFDFWNQHGVTSELASKWSKSGRSKSEFLDWESAGFTVAEAVKWIALDRQITPRIARRRSNAGITP